MSYSSLRILGLFQPVVMHLACVILHMNMNEALVAATLNAAASLGKSHSQGSIQEGKLGDLVLVDAPRFVEYARFAFLLLRLISWVFQTNYCRPFSCWRLILLQFVHQFMQHALPSQKETNRNSSFKRFDLFV